MCDGCFNALCSMAERIGPTVKANGAARVCLTFVGKISIASQTFPHDKFSSGATDWRQIVDLWTVIIASRCSPFYGYLHLFVLVGACSSSRSRAMSQSGGTDAQGNGEKAQRSSTSTFGRGAGIRLTQIARQQKGWCREPFDWTRTGHIVQGLLCVCASAFLRPHFHLVAFFALPCLADARRCKYAD